MKATLVLSFIAAFCILQTRSSPVSAYKFYNWPPTNDGIEKAETQPTQPSARKNSTLPTQQGCHVTSPIDLVFLIDSSPDMDTFQNMKNWMVGFMNDLNPSSFQTPMQVAVIRAAQQFPSLEINAKIRTPSDLRDHESIGHVREQMYHVEHPGWGVPGNGTWNATEFLADNLEYVVREGSAKVLVSLVHATPIGEVDEEKLEKVHQAFDHIYTVAIGDEPNSEFARKMKSQWYRYIELPNDYDVIEKFSAKVCTEIAEKLVEAGTGYGKYVATEKKEEKEVIMVDGSGWDDRFTDDEEY